MGAGASQEFAQAIAPNTNKRHGMGKRKAAQKAQADMNRQLLEKYDKDKTGALTREEVRAFAEDVLSHYTPVMGGVTEADIDMVMRLGGENTKDEVKADELPQAISILAILRSQNHEAYDLFNKFDTDRSGSIELVEFHTMYVSARSLASNFDFSILVLECVHARV